MTYRTDAIRSIRCVTSERQKGWQTGLEPATAGTTSRSSTN
jgi:hypothetical protein